MELSTLIELYGKESNVPLTMKENGTLALAFSKGVVVNLEHDAVSDLLHLYVIVGTEPHSDLECSILFRLLLGANSFGHETNGANLGLDRVSKEILLTDRLHVKDTNVSQLSTAVQRMAETGEVWRDRLSRAHDEAPRNEMHSNSMPPNAPMFGIHA